MSANDVKMIYKRGKFDIPFISLATYRDDFFQLELDLESELFFEFRKKHGWLPYKINESSETELKEIKEFFNKNKETFLFYFNNSDLVGSILYFGNYINCLSINRKYQRNGFGILLTKYVINKILDSGYKTVELNVFSDNTNAINMYKKIGFVVI